MIQNTGADLDCILKPSSVAVVGASSQVGKWGFMMVQRLLASGFSGRVYPVNPGSDEIQGLSCYPTVFDLPETVDLAVITTPAASVPDRLRDCALSGIRGGVVISAGFAETGEKGLILESEARSVSEKYGIRFVGPNCMGLWSAAVNLNLCFSRPVTAGPVSFISQSGTFGVALAQVANEKGYGLRSFISIGNQADLDVSDYLSYLADDDDTKVITIYLEGLRDGRRFFETAERVSKIKPIVLYKAGRSLVGQRATMSHTASVAGSGRVFDGMCRQAGIIQVREAFHLFEIAEALVGLPLPAGNRVAILGSGGQGVVGTDACSALGLDLPELDPETASMISALLPGHAPPAKNPVDFAGSRRTALQEADIIRRLLELDYIDGVISNVPVSPQIWDLSLDIDPDRPETLPEPVQKSVEGAKIYASLPAAHGKPIICLRFARLEKDVMESILKDGGIPIYDTPEQCARAMSALVYYGKVR